VYGLYLTSSGKGPVVGSSEHENEPSYSVQKGNFLDS